MPGTPDANKQREALQAMAAQEGITPEDVRRAGWHLHDTVDPYGPNPWSAQEDVEWNEFEQSATVDFLSGVYNELVLGLGEGYVNLMPTIALATGPDEDGLVSNLSQDWIENTSAWFNKQRTLYSDSAYEPAEHFSDYFSSGKVASTLGEGVGFVLGIAGGGGLNKVGKVVNASNKAKSFATGTLMMYSDLYDESINAGFEAKDAARIALGTAGVVSMTEGKALELIGKGATSWIPKEVATKALSNTFKESAQLGVKDFWKTQKLFSKNLMAEIGFKGGAKSARNALGNALKAGGRGAGIEFGQEFFQTYIEDGLKEAYDTFITKSDHFTKEMLTWDQFEEATYGGIIGAMIGGGMGAGAKINNNIDTALGFIDKKVKSNDFKGLNKMYDQVDAQLQKGTITEEEHSNVRGKLEDLQKFSEQTKRLNITDNKANHQLYEALRAKEEVTGIVEQELSPDDVDPLIAKYYNENKAKSEKITEKLDEEIDYMLKEKKPVTKSKARFEKMMNKAKGLYKKVINNDISDEKFEKELDDFGIKSKENVQQKSQDATKIKEAGEIKQDNKSVSPIQKEQKVQEKEKIKLSDSQIKSIEDSNNVKIKEDPKTGEYKIEGTKVNQEKAQAKIDSIVSKEPSVAKPKDSKEGEVKTSLKVAETTTEDATSVKEGSKPIKKIPEIKKPLDIKPVAKIATTPEGKIEGISQDKTVTYQGKKYSVSPEGTIRNENSGNIVSKETVLGKQILQQAGAIKEASPEIKEKRSSIEKEFTERKNKSKAPKTLDFGKSNLGSINDQLNLDANDDLDVNHQLSGFSRIKIFFHQYQLLNQIR